MALLVNQNSPPVAQYSPTTDIRESVDNRQGDRPGLEIRLVLHEGSISLDKIHSLHIFNPGLKW
jgi:hypothetical protein